MKQKHYMCNCRIIVRLLFVISVSGLILLATELFKGNENSDADSQSFNTFSKTETTKTPQLSIQKHPAYNSIYFYEMVEMVVFQVVVQPSSEK